jgi:hypothetical protein
VFAACRTATAVVAAVLCISGNISPGLAGLCLVYALDLTRYLKHGTAMASKTESDFNSVERVVQYLQVRRRNSVGQCWTCWLLLVMHSCANINFSGLLTLLYIQRLQTLSSMLYRS